MSKKKVIVTGGLGFIGSHISDALVEAGYEVHVVDNLTTGSRDNLNKEATLHIADVRNLADLVSIFKDAEYVFHQAAYPQVQYSIENPIETNEVNITGTLNVLEASRLCGVKKFIFASSCAVYGTPKSLPTKEDSLLLPISPYGLQKYVGELYAKMYADLYGLKTVCLRYFNVYGKRQNTKSAYSSVISTFINLKKNNLPLTITGDGSQTRDFVNVKDVASANLLAMISDNVGHGEILNIGGGQSYSVNHLAKLIGGPLEYINSRIEPKDSLADISLAKSLLSWQPRILLEDGVKDLMND